MSGKRGVGRGSCNSRAKLTEEIVLEARRMHSSQRGSGRGQRALARRYGVSRGAMKQALKGETWGHVKQEGQ